MQIEIRKLEPGEAGILRDFLCIATRLDARVEDASIVDLNPGLNRYFLDWGRQGDCALVAQDTDSGRLVSCTWGRIFQAGQMPEIESVSDRWPEIATATLEEFRGKGIGTRVLGTYVSYARKYYPAIFLSVRKDNPALNMYARFGFREVPGRGHRNRTGSESIIMRLDLADATGQ